MLKTYAERIRFVMDEKGISQAELAKRTGLNKGAISSYLNNKYKPKQDAIYLLANALGVSEIWLMGLTENMQPSDIHSQWGNDKANREYLAHDPQPLALYNEIKDRQDIYILFDKTKDLDPKAVESVLMFVQTIRKQRGIDD